MVVEGPFVESGAVAVWIDIARTTFPAHRDKCRAFSWPTCQVDKKWRIVFVMSCFKVQEEGIDIEVDRQILQEALR